MFQTYASAWPLGHEPEHLYKEASTYLFDLEKDLEDVQMRNLFPISKYLEILDSMTHYLPTVYELRALNHFLLLVQDFIGRTKTRIALWGMPLEVNEVQTIVHFANRWLQRRGGALDMGPPEAKVVLYSLRELGFYNDQALAIRNGNARASTV